MTVPRGVSAGEWHRHLTPNTRAIIVNSPRNPDGAVLTREEWRHLHARGLTLIADEVYNEFTVPEAPFVSAGLDDPDLEHTVILNTVSKNFGMSGFRIGYLIARPETADTVLLLNQHLITCAPTAYVVGNFDRILSATRPQIAEVVARRDDTARALHAARIATAPGTATFYLLADLSPSTLDSARFAAELYDRHGVSVVAGSAYGPSCAGHVRISVGTETTERVRRLARLRAQTR